MKKETIAKFNNFIDEVAAIEVFYHAVFQITPSDPSVTITKFGRNIPPKDFGQLLIIAKVHGLEVGIIQGDLIFGVSSLDPNVSRSTEED